MKLPKAIHDRIRNAIRDVPDFPKPGILFKDITPVLADGQIYRLVINTLADRYAAKNVDLVAGIDARGFILGGAIAYKLSCGFIPVRKKGKLPWKCIEKSYSLEYGENTLAIHEDALKKGQNVVIIDDLLATGGTALATAQLVEKLGGNVVEIAFLVELGFLKGREKFGKYPLYSMVNYE